MQNITARVGNIQKLLLLPLLLALPLLASVILTNAIAQSTAAKTPYIAANLELSRTINTVALSADGKRALSGGRNTPLRLWDTATGLLLQTLDAGAENINTVAFSPSGSLALAGDDYGKLYLWNWRTGELVAVMEGHTGEVLTTAFSPDGRLVASGGKDKTIRIWDVASGALLKTFEGHAGTVMSVAFSPDGRHLLSGGADNMLLLWDANTGHILNFIESHLGAVTSVAYSPDGRYLLSGSLDKSARLWDADTERLLKTFSGHSSGVLSAVFSPGGGQVLTASGDKTLKLWDISTGKAVRTFKAHSHAVTSAAFSLNGRHILSGSWDKTLRWWNADTGKAKTTIDVTKSRFSANGHTSFYYGQALNGTPDLAKLDERLKEKGFQLGDPVFLRILKGEAILELWMKRQGRFELFATYPICAWSGRLGPKRAEGDRQSPEGFYTISKGQLNPNSSYHLAFNLGYPNAFDRAHKRTGAYLMVHGACASIGCYAMTDDVIDEVWKLVTAALNKGQTRISVHAYPFRLTDARLAAFDWHPSARFWRDMKRAYDLFEGTRIPPEVAVCRKRYVARPGNAAAKSVSAVRVRCFRR
jgi:murein L,D-transpeptidase YafK/tricorn protease-like protein